MFEYFLLTISLVLVIVAIVGCVVPAIPGPLFAYCALWIFHASQFSALSITYMLILGMITLIVFFADYFLPPLITKKFGGTKYAAWGSIIGLFAGMILTPIGMIVGMLLGAFLGELLFAKKSGADSLIATLGAFLGFIAGTGRKLFLCCYILYVQIKETVLYYIN